MIIYFIIQENMKRIILLIVILMMSASCLDSMYIREQEQQGKRCVRTIDGGIQCFYKN